MPEFVHLHLHTDYSLLDSTIRVPDLIRKVKEVGMSAVAVTDHGLMSGVVEFYEAAVQGGIKPILGCEVCVSTGNGADSDGRPVCEGGDHLILLAENDEGYKNLVRIVSAPRFGEFPGELAVDKDLLRRYGKGLIATSACRKGEIPNLLEMDLEASAERALEEYRGIFTDGRFFLEIQDTGISGQGGLNEKLIRLARRSGTPLVATNDCHYLDRDNARELEILRCVKLGVTISERKGKSFPPARDYVKSPGEMERVFGHVAPEALVNTLVIAERCNVTLTAGKMAYPRFEFPGGITPDDYLRVLAFDGLSERLREKALRGESFEPGAEEKYSVRLERELGVIHACGAPVYFLVMHDAIHFANEQGIPVGPARGSLGGSLLAWCIHLSEIDPIPFGLQFERFLNPRRSRLPDIDTDFCRERRGEVIRHLEEKYGKPNVAQVSTFGTMRWTRAIKDVGLVLEVPDTDIEELLKQIPDDNRRRSLASILEEELPPGMIEVDHPRIGEVLSIASALEGINCYIGKHASSVAITDGPVAEKVPVFFTKDGVVTQYNFLGVESAGVVKFDFLGFRVLSVIGEAVRRIREGKGIEIDLLNIPLDDASTYAMVGRGDVSGVFGCESKAFVQLLRQFSADNFPRLFNTLALFRPGPLLAGVTDEYILRRHGRRGPIRVAIPEVEEILGETFGLILYQEQLIDIASRVADYSMEKADLFRVAICRKDPAKIERERPRFIEGGVRTGHTQRRMEQLFDQVEKEGGCSFNKSHAVSYGLIMYRTAYLKCHYPLEYSAALEKYPERE